MEAGWNFGLLPWTLPARSCLPARARCPDFPQSASTPSPFDIKHRQRQPRLQYTHKPTIPARLLHLADGSYGERLNPEGIPMSIDAGTGNPLSQSPQSDSALCCLCPVDQPMVIHILVATCPRWRRQCSTYHPAPDGDETHSSLYHPTNQASRPSNTRFHGM